MSYEPQFPYVVVCEYEDWPPRQWYTNTLDAAMEIRTLIRNEGDLRQETRTVRVYRLTAQDLGYD
jgi:hypothetical protein